jgi:hypothetical protein
MNVFQRYSAPSIFMVQLRERRRENTPIRVLLLAPPGCSYWLRWRRQQAARRWGRQPTWHWEWWRRWQHPTVSMRCQRKYLPWEASSIGRSGNFVANNYKSKGRLKQRGPESVWNTVEADSLPQVYFVNRSRLILIWNVSKFHCLEPCNRF